MLAIIPKVDLSVRPATMEDLPFLDSLQKQHHRELGFFPRAQMEGYIRNGWVLIAQDAGGKPLGYCASRDRYLKRDELGVIYQLCVAPGVQRKLVGASLVKAAFERSAYGCRLYCCWCAQDLEANYFWESMGFVPIAFRAGSTGKKRVHIFWQKRIIDGDAETKWWYPFQTNAGAIREDRIVLPIPPGVHWKEVKRAEFGRKDPTALPAPAARAPRGKAAPAPAPAPAPRPGRAALTRAARLHFAAPPAAPAARPKRQRKPQAAIDPRHLAAARELRDRYLERVNLAEAMLPAGKYNLARALPDASIPLARVA